MGSRQAIAIDLGRRRVRALLADQRQANRGASSSNGTVLRIRRTLIADIPPEINSDDPTAVGQWLGQALKDAKIPRGKAIISIAREHVGVKRITLPTTVDDELPLMTRLAMQRELPFDAETAIIDFVPVERSQTSTTVLAVAVPQAVSQYAQAVAKAAGLSIERITLRTMGSAALLNSLNGSLNGAAARNGVAVGSQNATPNGNHSMSGSSGMAIDVTGEGVEFCVMADGAIRFSRAAEVPHPQDQLAIADAVVTETRRTWMSYRVGDNVPEVPLAMIMGDRRVSEYAAGPLSEMLKIPVSVLQEHPRVEIGDQNIDGLWPLAGLLLEPAVSHDVIDFGNPRQAPDLAARTRVRRLLIAAMLLVTAGALWTAARFDLNRLRSHAADLTSQRQDQMPDFQRFRRAKYRLEHLKKWETISVDWLAHARNLASLSPPPDRVVLDSWSGTLDVHEVAFNKKTNALVAEEQLTIVIDGEAANRETADAFRNTLVQASIYTTSSSGADATGGKRLPFGFTYRLRTDAATPPAKSDSQAGGASPSKISPEQQAAAPSPSTADAQQATAAQSSSVSVPAGAAGAEEATR